MKKRGTWEEKEGKQCVMLDVSANEGRNIAKGCLMLTQKQGMYNNMGVIDRKVVERTRN